MNIIERAAGYIKIENEVSYLILLYKVEHTLITKDWVYTLFNSINNVSKKSLFT